MTRVLFICTANRCRSPIAAALLRQRLPRGAGIKIASAGLLPGGSHMPEPGVERLRDFGIDLSHHVSTQVTHEDLHRADLVLAMTRSHARAVVAQARDIWPVCFTLKDFVRLADREALQVSPASVTELVSRLAAGRELESIMGTSKRDDITDPMGRSAPVWNAVVAELDHQVERLAGRLAPSRAVVRGPRIAHRAPTPR